MDYIDLHIHTTASDGSNRPAEVAAMAARAGYRAIAITDHDNLNGVDEAVSVGEHLGLEVVPGIELSTDYAGTEVHILGYFVDPGAESLSDLLAVALRRREARNERITEVLRAAGIQVTMDEVRAKFPGTVLGRPHIAMVMMDKGYVSDVRQAFREYMGKGAKCYVPKINMPLDHAVDRILRAGGLPVLAHPFQYKRDDAGLRELIEYCMEQGLRGMECRYSGYSPEQSAYLEALAEEYGLVKTGGSDFHGSNKPQIALGTGIMDNLSVPYEWLVQLKELAGK